MGFKKAEVESIMTAIGISSENMPSIISDLTEWYDGYLFYPKAKEKLYNSDMVMYFAAEYERFKSYPTDMLDTNIASDYTKVRKVFIANSEENTFVPLLKQLTEHGEIMARLTSIFNFEKKFTEYDIISLLFYMGWLTIKEAEEGERNFIFKIPNRVIQELCFN
jgi:Predicted AAA-ATPase